ncbi:MAG: sensor histidine kinase [Geminicoccaceae bacterium]
MRLRVGVPPADGYLSSAMASRTRNPRAHRGLSARLLLWTIIFVLLGEVLIYVPSIARFRRVYLEETVAAAHLATYALEAAGPEGMAPDQERRLLDQVRVSAISLAQAQSPNETHLMLGETTPVAATFDLRQTGWVSLIVNALATVARQESRMIRVIGESGPGGPIIDVSMDEAPLTREMRDYSWRILTLSLFLSVLTAVLLFAILQVSIVRPLHRLTASISAFRERPADMTQSVPPSRRSDEIGIVEDELTDMQNSLRSALAQQTRLAALGAAVSKINHDLRNILSSALLLSDRLERSEDPKVKEIAPRLIDSLDRAARLCSETLHFSRAQPSAPRRTRFAARALIDDVAGAVIDEASRIRVRNEVREDIMLHADRDQLYRVLLNLMRNAEQAMRPQDVGVISLSAWRESGHIVIEVADTGPGIPVKVSERLFDAFSASTRPDGTGLGLPIARELMRAHGGDIALERTGADGTVFHLILPDR